MSPLVCEWCPARPKELRKASVAMSRTRPKSPSTARRSHTSRAAGPVKPDATTRSAFEIRFLELKLREPEAVQAEAIPLHCAAVDLLAVLA